jgi:hypothetical protein
MTRLILTTQSTKNKLKGFSLSRTIHLLNAISCDVRFGLSNDKPVTYDERKTMHTYYVSTRKLCEVLIAVNCHVLAYDNFQQTGAI